jgi:hemerythrin
MFEMKPEYYIGIDMIDQEHKQLFDYASEAYELLQEEFTPDKYDKIDAVRGMDIIMVTTANTDEEGRELLKLLGAPFSE